MNVTLRAAKSEDKDFVMSTWLRGQYWGSDYWNGMSQDVYFKEYGTNVQRLLDKSGTQVDIAEAEGVILGYIVYNDQVLFWSYVKKDYRNQGILKSLVKNMDFVSTISTTKIGRAITKKKGLEFNPFKES